GPPGARRTSRCTSRLRAPDFDPTSLACRTVAPRLRGRFITRRNHRAGQDAGMNSGALLLTGVPGVGKTTVLRRVKERLAGRRLRGFVTDEIRSRRGERLGF